MNRNIVADMNSQAYRGDFNTVLEAGRWWVRGGLGPDNGNLLYEEVLALFNDAIDFAKHKDAEEYNGKGLGAYRQEEGITIFDEDGNFRKKVRVELLIGWNLRAYVTMVMDGKKFDMGVFHTLPKPIEMFIEELSQKSPRINKACIASELVRLAKDLTAANLKISDDPSFNKVWQALQKKQSRMLQLFNDPLSDYVMTDIRRLKEEIDQSYEQLMAMAWR